MSKEKFVMTSLMAGAVADVTFTFYEINALHFEEIGIAGSRLYSENNMEAAYVARIGFTALLVGMYALTKAHPGKMSFSFDRAARILNVMSWGVVAMNALQLVIK